MPILSIMRDSGVRPSIVRITTTDTLAQITTNGYLDTQLEAIRQINYGPFEWVLGDLVSIDYADGEGYFSYDFANQTFVQSGGGGSGANVNLSNLEAPTAVNQDIVPDGDRTRNLGSETNRFQEIYFGDLRVPYVSGTLDPGTVSAWNSVTNSWDLLAGFFSGPNPTTVLYKDALLLNGLTNVTPAPGDNSHKLADTAFVQQELAAYVPPAPPAPNWGDIGGTLSNQTDLQNELNSKADSSSLGAYATLLCNLNAAVDPTSGDDSSDGYDIGSRWINVNTNKEFVCIDDTTGAAVWEETTGGAPFDRYTYETATVASSLTFREATNNGANTLTIRAPATIFSNTVLSFRQGVPDNNLILTISAGAASEFNRLSSGVLCYTGLSTSPTTNDPMIVPVGAMQHTWMLPSFNYRSVIGTQGIDLATEGLELEENVIYLFPIYIPSRTLSTLPRTVSFAIHTADATATIRIGAYAAASASNIDNIIGNPAGGPFVNRLANNTGMITAPFTGLDGGAAFIALKAINIDTKVSICAPEEVYPDEAIQVTGLTAKTGGSVVYGYSVDSGDDGNLPSSGFPAVTDSVTMPCGIVIGDN